MREMSRGSLGLFGWMALVLGSNGLAWSAESELVPRWRGAWVVIGVPVYSACNGSYTNNEVNGTLVTSKGDRALEKGEIGRVHKVDVGKKKVDVLIDLVEPLLISRTEGPFTLYDARECRVELQIALPRTKPKPEVDELDQWVRSLLERHTLMEEAQQSSLWNEREAEAFPDDYDQTLAEYEEWKAEQLGAEIDEKLEDYAEEAQRIVERLEVDADSLAGFGEGVDDARDRSFTSDCDRLVDMTVSGFARTGSSSESDDWREGYEDGQELVFYLEMIERLLDCREKIEP